MEEVEEEAGAEPRIEKNQWLCLPELLIILGRIWKEFKLLLPSQRWLKFIRVLENQLRSRLWLGEF